MKTNTKWILGTATIVTILFLFLLIPRGTPQRAILNLTGPEGLPFTGSIISDGVEVQVTGKLPADFGVSGRNVECQFRKIQAEGALSIRILMPNSSTGSATTIQPQGGVRAFIQRGLFAGGFGTSTI
jgi:hypothetical protein